VISRVSAAGGGRGSDGEKGSGEEKANFGGKMRKTSLGKGKEGGRQAIVERRFRGKGYQTKRSGGPGGRLVVELEGQKLRFQWAEGKKIILGADSGSKTTKGGSQVKHIED